VTVGDFRAAHAHQKRTRYYYRVTEMDAFSSNQRLDDDDDDEKLDIAEYPLPNHRYRARSWLKNGST